MSSCSRVRADSSTGSSRVTSLNTLHTDVCKHEDGVYAMKVSHIPSRRLNRSSYLLEVEFLEHADADLVVQADFHLKLLHPKFSDPWWKQTQIFSVQQLSAWLVFHLTSVGCLQAFKECSHRNTSSFLSPLSRCLCLCSWALSQARNFMSGTDETSESSSGQTLCITCYHDLQLSQGGLRGVSQENVDISHHALLLFHAAVSPPLLVQDDERTLWKHRIKKSIFKRNSFSLRNGRSVVVQRCWLVCRNNNSSSEHFRGLKMLNVLQADDPSLSLSSLQLLCMSYSCSRVSGSDAVSCWSSALFIHS